MTDRNQPSFKNTSLPLIILTLVVGIALGWLLRDMFRQPIAPTLAPSQPPAVSPAPTAAPAAARPTLAAPTATPTAIATAAPTATPAPTNAPAPTATPTATATPAPTAAPATVAPAADGIAGYVGHTVAEGETIEAIAASGGSTADLIRRYNLLDGDPQPGRALIVPQLQGQASTLASAPLLIERGPTKKPWIALTLDAGADSAPTPDMLKTLREHNVKITFFLTGKWIKENPELTRQIVADGHEIANHTFTHPDLRNLSDAAIRKELADTEALLKATAGASARPFFRPPFGAYDKRVLQLTEAQGYLPIYWTLDSLDSVGEIKTPEFLLERITAKLTPDQLRGAIILAHCGSRPTADALPKVLDRFAEMGFEVKKLSEVLNG